jgi:lactococcin 972 family bacteriocin
MISRGRAKYLMGPGVHGPTAVTLSAARIEPDRRGGAMNARRKIVPGVAAAALTVGSALPALAATEYPGGGIWNYGVNEIVYSYYQHRTSIHGSSVVNGWGTRVSSGCKSPGVTARAEAPARTGYADYAYWAKSSC